MAGPNGALGGTFKIVRILQVVSLIAIIGMAANFISEMVSNNNAPSDVLVGTLSVVCLFGDPRSDIDANRRCVDVHCGALLRHHVYPVHRRPPPVSHHHRIGQHVAYRLDRGCSRCRQTSIVPQLPSNWNLQHGRVCVPTWRRAQTESPQ